MTGSDSHTHVHIVQMVLRDATKLMVLEGCVCGKCGGRETVDGLLGLT